MKPLFQGPLQSFTDSRRNARRAPQEDQSKGPLRTRSVESEVRECLTGDERLDRAAGDRHPADSVRVGSLEERPVGHEIAVANDRRGGGEHDGATTSERHSHDVGLGWAGARDTVSTRIRSGSHDAAGVQRGS